MPDMPETNELIDGGQSEELNERKVVLLTRDNPIEADLLDYAKQINQDTGLTNADQLELVKGVVQDLPYARHYITEGNRGFLATISYPFRAYSYDNTGDLMDIAGYGLLEAALRFDPKLTHNFLNFAAPIVQELLVKEFPWAKQNKLLTDKEEPIYTVIRFASTVKEAKTSDELLRKAEQDEALSSAEPMAVLHEHADVLRYIHLPDIILYEKYGIKPEELNSLVKSLCQQLDLPNRASLALLCFEEGITFDLVLPPQMPLLRTIERRIAPLLHLPYKEVAERLGLEEVFINTVATRIRKKFQARNRTELALMTTVMDVTPVHDALAPFTAFEQTVLPLINLDTTEIMSRLGLSQYDVSRAIDKAAMRVGVNGRKGLASYLQQQGFQFDIPEPLKPLHEIFDSRQMELAQNLHLNNEHLEPMTGLVSNSIESLIKRLRKRSGAKNRVELMLMARMYDTGERRGPDERTKRDKLAHKLGWGTLDVEKLQVMFENINERQKKLIEAYYLSAEDITWPIVAREHRIDRATAVVTARAGILRIRKMSEAAERQTNTSELQ